MRRQEVVSMNTITVKLELHSFHSTKGRDREIGEREEKG
jgi:hypothetical protein